jgi:membrane protein implicated in regulation of membrane protease activity
MTLRAGGLGIAGLALWPGAASACAVCVDSAWGNRGFGWPYVMLMVAPFAVAASLVVAVYLSVRASAREGPDAGHSEGARRACAVLLDER